MVQVSFNSYDYFHIIFIVSLVIPSSSVASGIVIHFKHYFSSDTKMRKEVELVLLHNCTFWLMH